MNNIWFSAAEIMLTNSKIANIDFFSNFELKLINILTF